MRLLLHTPTLFLVMCFSQGFSQNIGEGLLLHYPAAGNFYDYSGNDFTTYGNATFGTGVNGEPDQAFSFNGVDQFLDFPNMAILKPELPISFAYWVYLESTNPTDAVFFVTDFGYYQHSGAWMNISSNGRITISYGTATGGLSGAHRRTKQGESSLEVGQWYYIVGVIRGPTDMSIYINCEDDGGAYNGTGGSIGYTNTAGTIGRKYGHNSFPAYYFDGKIANFRYYDRELYMEDIDRLCEVETMFTVSVDDLAPAFKQQDKCLVNVYPNPANQFLTIDGDVSSDAIIRFFNLQGQLLKEVRNQQKIDVSDLASGSYVVQIGEANCRTNRLLITR